ncbi:hypothetical protein GCM10028805_10110 [Spirosoma harenae]
MSTDDDSESLNDDFATKMTLIDWKMTYGDKPELTGEIPGGVCIVFLLLTQLTTNSKHKKNRP